MTSAPACWVLLTDWIAFSATAENGTPISNASAKACERQLQTI
jgi:hypothetical protein